MSLARRPLLALAAAASLTGRSAFAQSGGTLRVAVDSEYRNWNPAQVASNGVAIVARKIVETLFDLAPDAKTLVPVLATGWTQGPDGLTHTFALRSGVVFHDGRPFTSSDVAFSALSQWKTLQNFGRDVFRALDAVDTPDPLTAVFRYSRPMPAQLLAAALPALSFVVPRHVYDVADQAANPANTALVGTGPFRFGEYRRGEVYRVVRNPAHWRGASLERIDFRIMPDKGAVAASLEAGEIDLACFGGVSVEDAGRLGSLPGFEATARGYEALLYTSIAEFNFDRPELKDVRVRHAIAHALDPASMASTILGGFGGVATSPIPRTDPVFHASGLPSYPHDPARASALLDEAGYPRGANGTRFALRIVPAPFFDQTKRIGEAMRQSLRAVGIDASVVATDLPGYFAAVYRNRAFDLTSGIYVHRQDPAISMAALYRSGTPAGVPFSNQRGWQSAEMDGLLARADAEMDGARRVALYAEVQRLAMTELPLLPLVGFALRIVPAPFFDQTKRIGEAMRQSLRAVGIDASVVATDLPGFFAAVYRNRAFDLTAGIYVHRQDPAISMAALYRSGTPAGVPFSNQRGWQSAEMDGLLARADAEMDGARRVALYAEVQRLAMTELPLLPMVEFALPSVLSRKLRNTHDNPRWAVTGWEPVALT